MNYFFEFIDSYYKHSCCVSRIDEGANDPIPQERMAAFRQVIVSLIKASEGRPISEPKDNNTLPSRNSYVLRPLTDGNYSIKIGGTTYTYNKEGGWVVPPKKLRDQKEVISKALGEETNGGATQPGAQQPPPPPPPPVVPEMTPEQLKQQKDAQKLAEKEIFDALKAQVFEIGKGLFDSLSPEEICKARLGEFLSMTQKKYKSKEYAYDRKFLDHIYDLVDPIGEQGDSCEAINQIKNTRGLKNKTDFLRYLSEDENDLVKKATKAVTNVAIKQLSEIFTVNEQSLKKVLDTKCDRSGKKSEPVESMKQECLTVEQVAVRGDDEDLAAAKETFQTYLDFLSGRKDIKDPGELKKLRNSMVYTVQGDLLIAGTNLHSMIMVSDGNRALFNVLATKFETMTGLEPKIIDTENFAKDANKMASIRGKVDEHMPVVADLVQKYLNAFESGDKELAKKIAKSVDKYMQDIEHLCTYTQAMRQYVAGFEQKKYSLTSDSLEAFAFMRNETRNLRYCSDISDILPIAIGFASNRVEYMSSDLVIQVGDDVGDGVRQDLVYAYNTPEKAHETAKRLGVSSDFVIPIKLSDVLDISKQYKKHIPEDLLGEDTNREIYIILEGVKIEAGTQTTYGSLSMDRLLKSFIETPNEIQKLLKKRTRSALGISGKSYDLAAVDEHQQKFAKDIEKYKDTISKVTRIHKVIKDGKRVKESGSVLIRSILDDLKATKNWDQNLQNPVLSVGEDLIKTLDNPKYNNTAGDKRIEKLKSNFIDLFKREKLFNFVKDSFSTNEDGTLKDKNKAAAAADILGRTGQNYLPMITTINKASKSRGEAISYRIDHSEAATGCLAALLRGEASIETNPDDSFGGMNVAYRDPNGKERRAYFTYKEGTIASSGNMKNSEASKLSSELEESKSKNPVLSKDHPLVLETLKFLSGHLRQLSELIK